MGWVGRDAQLGLVSLVGRAGRGCSGAAQAWTWWVRVTTSGFGGGCASGARKWVSGQPRGFAHRDFSASEEPAQGWSREVSPVPGPSVGCWRC